MCALSGQDACAVPLGYLQFGKLCKCTGDKDLYLVGIVGHLRALTEPAFSNDNLIARACAIMLA